MVAASQDQLVYWQMVVAMLIPHTIDPVQLVPEGGELDEEMEVSCLCGRTNQIKNVKLSWLDLGDGYGYRAVCCQGCITARIKMGSA